MTNLQPSRGRSLVDRILDVAARSGPAPFLRLLSPEGVPIELSYLALLQQASIWVRIFKKHGLGPRQRIIILVPHSVDAYASFLGALVSGLVPAMLPPPSPKTPIDRVRDMVHALLPATRPDATVVGAGLKEVFDGSARSRVIPTHEALTERPIENLELVSSGSDGDIAFLQYSSGTTGLRKGVAISHECCLRQADLYASAIGLRSDDSIVSWLPLYHDMGLIACWMLPLLTGTPVTAMSPFDWVAKPVSLIQAIRNYRSTLCWLPNFAFAHLTRTVADWEMAPGDLTSIRGFINCSEPIRQETHDAFLQRFGSYGIDERKMVTCYAMAEATFAITSSCPGQPPARIGVKPDSLVPGSTAEPGKRMLVSSGRPLSGTSLRIVDEGGIALADRVVGNIRVASPTLASGYIGNPDATLAAMGDGELRTGDLGFIVDGELFVLGRADDVIVVGGRNIFPEDIEAIIDRLPGAVPGRSVAFGVYDEIEGTSHVVVVAEREAEEAGDGLQRRISAELVSRMDLSPRAVRTVARGWLVKSTSGKISRRGNREKYLAESLPRRRDPLPAAAAATDVPLVDFVRLCVATVIGQECPGDDESLIVSGRIDSFALTALLAALAERFGDALPMPNVVGFQHFDSIGAMCRLLEKVERGFVSQSRQVSYGARDVKIPALKRIARPLDLLILGSSTSFLLPCRAVERKGRIGFNLAVNAATVADIFCLAQFSAEACGRIGRITVGLDVFAFRANAVSVVDLRSLSMPELTRYLDPDDRDAISGLGEAGPREAHAQRIYQQRLAEWRPGFWYSFGPNGDVSFGDPEIESGPSEVDRTRPVSRLHELAMIYRADFDGLCPKQSGYLRRLATFCAQVGVMLDLVIMPMSLRADALLASSGIYHARRKEVVDLAKHLESPLVKLHDFPTAAAFGGNDEDFIDAYHVGQRNAELLLGRVLGG